MRAERAHLEQAERASPAPALSRVLGAPAPRALTAAQLMALQRSMGNRAVSRLVTSGRTLSRSTWDEFVFAASHPFIAGQIYGGEQPAEVLIPSTSSLAVRFSVNLRADRQTELGSGGLIENPQHEGSQVNAMRHVLWNAINARRFGSAIATEAANAHEEHPSAIDGQDAATQTFRTLAAADEGADLRNNILGRGIGANSNATPKALAVATLQLFHDQGLWVAQPQGDGTFRAVRQTLTEDVFAAASRKLANLNEIGLTPGGVARWRAARDQEVRDAQSGLND